MSGQKHIATVVEILVRGEHLFSSTYPIDALDKLPKGTKLYTSPPDLEAENARLRSNLDQALKERTSEFNRGYVLACCNIMNLHRDEVVAFDVLRELGITQKEVEEMNLPEYDMSALRKIENARSQSPYK